MKYVLVTARYARDLEQQVNVLLDQGYELAGGVAVRMSKRAGGSPDAEEWVQAMICNNPASLREETSR